MTSSTGNTDYINTSTQSERRALFFPDGELNPRLPETIAQALLLLGWKLFSYHENTSTSRYISPKAINNEIHRLG